MRRSIVLGSIVLVAAAVALLLGRMGDQRGVTARAPASDVARATPEPALVALETPTLAAEAAEDGRAEGAPSARRVAPRDERPTIAGRVVVAGGIPAGEDATVTAEVYVGPVNRRGNMRQLTVPLAADGSFALAVPVGARYALLDLDARFLHLPESVRALPGETGVVLRPEVSAMIEGRVLLPLGVALRREAWNEVSVSYRSGLPIVSDLGQEFDLDTVVPKADGSFGFAFVPAGVELELLVTSPYGACKRRLAPLAPGEKATVALALDPGVTVGGRVIDEHGRPVEGVAVGVANDPRGGDALFQHEGAADAKTDADGRFTLTGLPRASLKLSARNSELARGAEAFVDGRAGDVHDLVLAVERGACIEGTVEWPDGRPVERFSVGALGRGIHSRASGAGGCFRLCGRGAGTHDVEVSANQDGVEGFARAQGVRAGGAALRLVLEIEELFTVRGTVSGHGAQPVDDFEAAVIHGVPASGSRSFAAVQATKEPSGWFLFEGLRAGEWTIRIAAPGMQQAEQRVLVGPDTAPLCFVLEAAGELRGQVLDAEGNPIAGAFVNELGARSYFRVHSTDGEGRFVLPWTTSPARIQARGRSHAPSDAVEIAVEVGETVDGVILRLRPPCRLEGRVLDADGRPLAGARVSVRGEHAGGSGETDARGEFALDELPPGTLQVAAWAQAQDRAQAEVTLVPGRTSTVELRFE